MAAQPDVEAAYAHCETLARSHYENFPVASWLVPSPLRRHVWAVYAFARTADDFADEPEWEGQRLEKLGEWEERLDGCLAGKPEGPVFVALADTIGRFDLPDRLFRDLLDAFRQDCRVRRYDDWGDLLDYCRRSANPVGRIVLRLFGEASPDRDLGSDAICTGLQLTNFWQDVAVDLRKDRIYLPKVDRDRFGVREEDLRRDRAGDGVRGLLLDLVGRTREVFRRGRALVTEGPGGRLGAELRAVWVGGHRILDRIEEARGDVLASRPALTAGDRLAMISRAVVGGRTLP